MSQSRMLAHNNNNNNVGSEQNSSGSDDDDSKPLYALTKGDLKVMIKTMVRRAVKEGFELEQERILNQNSGNKVHRSEPRSLQLQFQNKLSLPILTGRHIKGENCKSLNIALVDAFTREVVKYGPEASARVEIVVRRVDPDSDEGHDWTPQESNLKTAKESKEKKPLLTGNVFLNLKEGIGSADAIYFAHRSGWMKRCQFTLGARTVNNFDGTRVIEAKSEPFFLEDRRSKLYKKHHPPSMLDKVWRLEKISKNGARHKRLSRENVHSVKDFLTLLCINPTKLRNILGTCLSAKMWEVIVDHARACISDHKFYFYCPPGSQQKIGLVFNNVGQVMGLLSECQYSPFDKLSETEKDEAHKLLIAAFEQWGGVGIFPFDDEAFVTDGLLQLFNNDLHSNSAMLEKSDGSKILTSQTIGGLDPQPSVYSADIMPSIYSVGCVNSLDDFGFSNNIDSMDLGYDQLLDCCDQFENSLVCETESIAQTFYEDYHLQYFDPDCSLQSLKSSLESRTELHTSVNAVILSSSSIFAQKRWTVLVSVLKWFSSIQRILAKKTHGREKQI